MDVQEIRKYTKQLNVLFFKGYSDYYKEILETLHIFFNNIDIISNHLKDKINFNTIYSKQYSLIVVDRYPEQEIDTALHKILKSTPKEQIIVITESLDTSIIQFINCGIQEYLFIPFKMEQLKQTILNILVNKMVPEGSKINYKQELY